MKKGLVALILLLCSFVLIACGETEQMVIEGNDVLEIGFVEKYIVLLDGQELSRDEYLWTVSDETVLSLKYDEFTPLKEGVCDIRAILIRDGSFIARKTVTVVDALIKNVNVSSSEGTTLYLEKDNFINLDYNTTPSDASVTPVWSSSDETIATVDQDGLVIPVSKGEVTIYVTCGKAVGSIVINVKEVITEIKSNLPAEIVVGQGVELEFNIDDPVVSIMDDSKNEISELIGDMLYAKKTGVIKLSVKSKSTQQLNKVFEINVVEYKANTISYDQTKYQKETNNLLTKLSDSQKLGQMIMASTSARDLKEDTDGIYYSDTSGVVNRKVYVNNTWNGREIGNINYERVNDRDPLNSISLLQKLIVGNTQVGPMNMMYYSIAASTSNFTKMLSSYGLGKLSQKEFYQYQTNLAKELKEFGVNVYFTYGYDIYNYDYRYSNDTATNNYYSNLMRKAFEEQGIMVGYTFESDNNSDNDKKKLISMVNNNVDLIGITENIQDFDGNLSLVQYIRQTLKYEGILYYDVNFNNMIGEENTIETITNEMISAINQGVDLIWGQASINNSYYSDYTEQSFEIYDRLITASKDGSISKNRLDEAVSRILKKKIEYKMIEGAKVGEELTDFSSYNTYAESIYKNTYSISENYQALDKNKKTYIIGEKWTERIGGYYGGAPKTTFDFENALATSLNSKGYTTEVYNTFGADFDTKISEITTNDQVVIFMRYSTYSFTYRDNDDKKITKKVTWKNVVEELYNRGVTNVTVVVLYDEAVANSMSIINNRICANSNYDVTFSALIDLVEDGK